MRLHFAKPIEVMQNVRNFGEAFELISNVIGREITTWIRCKVALLRGRVVR